MEQEITIQRFCELRRSLGYTQAEFAALLGISSTTADIERGRTKLSGKVVTELEPVGAFWEAEPEHQDYLERIPNGYTCHFARPDWVLPKRAATQAAE